ncbi:class I SAM-dependent methyltransferase [Roseomonas eburnea]|uniref:Class I SAM-dependent methyltransferase n=1 Tax=Neoroseomonas eburnea TaxID=1346889 RepID=A0A9X9X5Q7_9PROT|nr:class I SAM-dependent methyltransferase [Neoroseomonas eburnea]
MPDTALQQGFWNRWNTETREQRRDEVSWRQQREVLGWLQALDRRDLDIIDVGCGAGWLTEHLLPFGRVTGTDLSDQVLARAATRIPQARFVPGDFMALDFGEAAFDVAVSLEVLSHVADQQGFLRRVARLLRPGGHLMLATQNRPILERNRIPPPEPGQLRRWVDRRELRALLEPEFEVLRIHTVTPRADRGLLRIANSYKLNRMARLVAGDGFERLKERCGLGWTIMALGRRRPSAH